ncbi:Aldose 1-epimerase [Xylanimonas cellulosilytica DSM 15894]|uniref:Aldose 1-epimerase n=1 Tax=Xylanimonas cellulosilytica (strain DSM 15894 / JCM 12276 / CECT 5975 / KCTC 9989 / LMG 20990 / NBRC 107835 / XIL07) TaxID=446471 RepID=D1BWF9_XYLCX|nr:aldose 1-epimerase family protein [Xylanimonas cellulosilytica]ACZ31504.1 Aldose 1-epimerase [Xylanimonas cellulosilytica DSM 15894]
MTTSAVPAPPPVSGTQYVIAHGEHRAVVAEVGAMVREYGVGGRDVFVPFGEDEVAPVFNGAVLLPWPNRLADGAYTVDGVTYEVAHTEPDRSNALHGLACWVRWTLVERSDDAVTLELALAPQKGWPFQLVTQVRYALSDAGLEVTVTTRNVGAGTAPYGIGFHPWLSAGGATLDECTVRLDATTHVTVDDRLLPTGTEPVAGPYDLREERSLAGLDLDDAWLDVTRDEQGLSWCRLGRPDGRTAAVWMDGSMDTWQVCSANHIPHFRRGGLAAEPMSCVADAFNTGERLVRLAPGDEHTVRWGATLL